MAENGHDDDAAPIGRDLAGFVLEILDTYQARFHALERLLRSQSRRIAYLETYIGGGLEDVVGTTARKVVVLPERVCWCGAAFLPKGQREIRCRPCRQQLPTWKLRALAKRQGAVGVYRTASAVM